MDLKCINTENLPEIQYSTGKEIDKKSILDDIYKMDNLVRMKHKKPYIKERCSVLANYSDVMFDSVYRLMVSSHERGTRFDYNRMNMMLDTAIGINAGTIDGDTASKQFGTDMYHEYVAPNIK